jgi:hypothetical protein
LLFSLFFSYRLVSVFLCFFAPFFAFFIKKTPPEATAEAKRLKNRQKWSFFTVFLKIAGVFFFFLFFLFFRGACKPYVARLPEIELTQKKGELTQKKGELTQKKGELTQKKGELTQMI